ncbi:MAG TPA: CHAT domain-containing protein [Candidatus Angelobacter sp.]|jgi:CHAT domain-containing protein
MRAGVIADQSKYRSLRLRAIALEAALHTNEGRLGQAWSSTARGLHLFFDGPYPPERGFQFFSELEFAAEEEAHWHLAALLQNEAIIYIHSLGRLDFEATAHFHLAAVEKALGNVENAKREIAAGQQLFKHLPAGTSRDFLEAESRVAMAALEARFGSPASAAAYLAGLDAIISDAGNFTVHLSYEQALADIQGKLGNQNEEVKHLRRCIEIGNQGFSSLSSPRDRWEWEQTVGQAYRRLLEIQISNPHDPAEALVSWENYKTAALLRNVRLPVSRTSSEQHHLLEQIRTLHDSTAIVFAQIADTTVAWIADDRGINEIKLTSKNKELAPLVQTFYRLCSDPTSPIEKVKSAGSRLYELLLGPLDQEFRLRGTLFIESDGAFGMLPWSALTTQDGSYLGTKFNILNTPGLIFRGAVAAEKDKPSPAVIAYPGPITLGGERYPSLPHAEAEAATLGQTLKNSVYLDGGKVTTVRLTDLLPHAYLFHFAGHAVTREFGGELLVQGTGGGELFSASTISSLNLTGLRLAVLAACNTGTGLDAPRNPNGLVGAFISSGTHRVIASTWAVDSRATSELMSDFYAALRRGSDERSIEETWRVAVSRNSGSHPYYWAGFQVFGSPD